VKCNDAESMDLVSQQNTGVFAAGTGDRRGGGCTAEAAHATELRAREDEEVAEASKRLTPSVHLANKVCAIERFMHYYTWRDCYHDVIQGTRCCCCCCCCDERVLRW
jgi:hypothetical protein